MAAQTGVTSIEFSTKRFNEFITKFAEAAEMEMETVMKRTALDLLTRIVQRTPVATGRARAGWQAAGDALGFQVPSGVGSQADDSGYEESLGGENKFIRMINRVDYIMYLEYGGSAQAPLGMVRVSMLEIQTGKPIPKYLQERFNKIWKTLKPGTTESGGRYTVQREAFRAALTGPQAGVGRAARQLNYVATRVANVRARRRR